jgi:hypothetical protein
MRAYTQRVRDSILPLSIAGTLPEAFQEWHFTGETEDHEEPIETCELCGHEDLRYHFEIQNEHNGNTLWVGSQCILQFDVAVFEGGSRLTLEEAKKKLEKLTQKMRLDSCIKALEKLSKAEVNPILRNALAYYQKNKYLTPKFAFVVFWRMKEHKIDHSPSFFKINLKRQKCIDDLKHMKTEHVHYFWNALSTSQKRRAEEMGHRQPPQ